MLPNRDVYYATLAGFELAKRHGTSRPDDDVLDEEDLWPRPQDKSSNSWAGLSRLHAMLSVSYDPETR